jgi:23S rRNA (cytidine1920-2'-O)/16S rRNA (cytidine1409-2'-O)-methyltransferase
VTGKERLDKLLLDRDLVKSRQQAQSLILQGAVLVNEQRINKPGTRVDSSSLIRLKSLPLPYVSRGGQKLEKALEAFCPHVAGFVCIDIGASTGGFTDCLLQRGAAKVYAVDVGHNQLAWKLRSDSRVVSLEGINARYLRFEQIGELADLITIDLSFISLTMILPDIPPFLKSHSRVICLVKPQFEVGKGQVEKGGLVTDPAKHVAVIEKIRQAAVVSRFKILGVIDSPLLGAEGNKEFLIGLEATREMLNTKL